MYTYNAIYLCKLKHFYYVKIYKHCYFPKLSTVYNSANQKKNIEDDKLITGFILTENISL